MKTLLLCPECRQPLPADAPGRLCPACLLASDPASPPAPPDARPRSRPLAGSDFGPYHILRLLGRGGMGMVFEAQLRGTGRRVALKVMSHGLTSEEDRKRFLREGRLAAAVNHPNVVYVHGSDEIDGVPVIAMELVAGGTLKDQLSQSGPLGVPEAAQAALQMIAGLEAAEAAGVLHRDIKPANCFVGADGLVKIGDFGLSVSTLARGESLLTAAGAVLGTPAYASPEQLRGQSLDVRSDIYSVGATLFHLLTGTTPFAADDFVRLITEVLDRPAPVPHQLRPDLPPGLSRILLRCLAKSPADRYQTYAALREALLPYAATASEPARPALRMVAELLDGTLAMLPSLLFLIYWSVEPSERLLQEPAWTTALIWLTCLAWSIGYHAIAEGCWGAGPGKALCGLQVIGPDRRVPGLARGLWRSLIFEIPTVLPVLTGLALVTLFRADPDGLQWLEPLHLALFVALFLPMRRRNHYATLHDRWSGTRVVVRPAHSRRPSLASTQAALRRPVIPQPSAVPMPELAELGPFEVRGQLPFRGEGELLTAYDPALRRPVWIHRRPRAAGAATSEPHDLSRPGRLRRLVSGQTDEVVWEAYEAPEGMPLLALTGAQPPWTAVRFWLLDLAEELAAMDKTPDTVVPLRLDRIWLTAEGRAVLLEFVAPGLEEIPDATEQAVDVSRGGQSFLASAAAALGGAPVPLYAQEFLVGLARTPFERLEYLVGNLRSLVNRPAAVSRRLRFGAALPGPGVAAALGLLIATLIGLDHWRWHGWWRTHQPGPPLVTSAIEAYTMSINTPLGGLTVTNAARHFPAYLSHHYGSLITNTTFWAQPEVTNHVTEESRRLLSLLVQTHPVPSPAAVRDAEAAVGPAVKSITRLNALMPLWVAAGMIVMGTGLLALTELLGALIFGQSLLFRLVHIGIVDRRHEPAGRWRLLGRWLAVWPAGVGLSVVVGGMIVLGIVGGVPVTFGVADPDLALPWTLALAVATVALAVLLLNLLVNPSRSLGDLIAGTRLVPR